ncbi:MAG: LPS-assembly protein LptD [Bdellovibrionaceae bacterium]|nr:LPS-assembly protein LptD [Pseudobdellovibrionaceae bacterium]MBX3034868.1 LPS-assembly protein LptD [Pseudobdellovibrionaceae bacterium]
MLLLFLLIPCLPALGAEPIARIQGLVINADSMDRDTETETVELSGQVQIVSQDRHIEADRARISLRARQVELNGRVRLTTSSSTVGGDRIVLDYESGTGVIYNGFVQSGSVMFEGAVIQKTGPEEYYVLDSDYTTCTNCPASWSFRGSSIRAELGSYAYMKNTLLRIGHVPVLWLPYLVVPLKSDRQSGLLTPGFGQSDEGGLAISQPYFWAISRSTDATFTLRNYELRGAKGLGNYRYLLDDDSGGELDVGYIYDRVFRHSERLNRFSRLDDDGDGFSRWFIRYSHYQEMPSGWIYRAQINNASDLQYPRDFSQETLNHGDPAMETRMSMTKNTDTRHFSVDSSYYTNLLQADPLGGNEDAVHRIPEIRYAQVPQAIGSTGFYYSLDLDYTNFTRSGPAYDDLTVDPVTGARSINNTCGPGLYGDERRCQRVEDGFFNNGDLIRAGQRLDMQPALFRPFSPVSGVDILPKISYRETHYNFPIENISNTTRRYLRAEIGSRVSFSRIYGDLNDPKATRYKHEIRPEVNYTVLPWIDHHRHPFFGFSQNDDVQTFENLSLSDSDLNGNSGLQFDYRDRIYDRNRITYSIVNTLTEKRWVNERPEYRQLALVKLSQSYDAWKDSFNDPNKEPWSDISMLFDLRYDYFQSYSTVNHFPYQKVTNSSARFRFNDDLGRFIQFGLDKKFTIVPGQPVDSSTRLEDYTLGGGFVARYINLMGKLTYDSVTSEDGRRLKSWAYIAQFKPPGDCWLITFTHAQVVAGDTSIEMGFEFNFDGVPKPPLPASALDKYSF